MVGLWYAGLRKINVMCVVPVPEGNLVTIFVKKDLITIVIQNNKISGGPKISPLLMAVKRLMHDDPSVEWHIPGGKGGEHDE